MGKDIHAEEERIRQTIRDALKAQKVRKYKLADEIGMGKSTLVQRLKGKSQFKLSEIIEICDVLGIKIEIGE
jgi:transcriptional regulator with XRE-family HTH domain